MRYARRCTRVILAALATLCVPIPGTSQGIGEDSATIFVRRIIAQIGRANDLDLGNVVVIITTDSEHQLEADAGWSRQVMPDSTIRLVPFIRISPAFMKGVVSNEAMLAGIIAHEIAHLVLNHEERWMTAPTTDRIAIQSEADSLAVVLVGRAGYRVGEFEKYLKSQLSASGGLTDHAEILARVVMFRNFAKHNPGGKRTFITATRGEFARFIENCDRAR
jgi:hypothetical protein